MPSSTRRRAAAARDAAGVDHHLSACVATMRQRLLVVLLLTTLLLSLPAADACGDHHHHAAPTTTTTTTTTTTPWPDGVSAATRRRLLARSGDPQVWEQPLGGHGRRRTLLSTTLRRCGTHTPDPAVRLRVERALAVRQAREAAKRVLLKQQPSKKTAAAPAKPSSSVKKPPSSPLPTANRRESAFVPSSGEQRTIEVPTYVTIVQREEDGMPPISDDLVSAQLDVLNRAYGSTPGSPVKWVFALKNLARVKSSESMCDQKVEARIKKESRKGGAGSLNLYFADLSECGLLGLASFPWHAQAKAADNADGVVIHFATMPGGSYPAYNMGFTCVHEVGHWFGLYHVWQNGCEGGGDSVDDTPATSMPTEGCPSKAAAASACGGSGEALVGNPMDYTDDACMQTFTVGQHRRMEAMYEMYRGGGVR
jgi:hypothetical protein